MSQNEKILDKIRNLLTLAEDGGNDEESQTALLMAQKLMLKHKVSQSELNVGGKQEIVTKALSAYKRLYWWEKILGTIIAENFRVLMYVQSNQFPHQKSIQRKIVFMGYPEDCELAIGLFNLASESMRHYAALHVKENETTDTTYAAQLRKSYYQGFMDGLRDKFAKQRADMAQESAQYALVIKTPQDVVERFNKEITGKMSFKRPNASRENAAYAEGYDKGTNIALTNKLLNN